MSCDCLKWLCNVEMVKHMGETNIKFNHQSPLELAILPRVIRSWNTKMSVKMEVFVISTDGTVTPSISDMAGDNPKVVFIRLRDNRWEGCGYFQDSIPPEAIAQPIGTISAISSIDIAPVTHTRTSSETSTPESMPSVVTERHKSSDPTNESFLEVSTSLNMLIDMLPFWMEVFDFSSIPSLRSAPGIVLSEATKLEKTLYGVLDIVRINATSAQKDSFTT